MTTQRFVMPFHTTDPVDRVGFRCGEPQCSRAEGHPGPHRSVKGEGAVIHSDTFWWSER